VFFSLSLCGPERCGCVPVQLWLADDVRHQATLSDCQLDAQAMLFVDLTESDDEQQDE